jgi:TonB family protein
MSPGTRNGKPVRSKARVPITFAFPSGGGGGGSPGRKVTTIMKPMWVTAPRRADVAAAYPAKLRAQPIRGAATLDCRVRADGTIHDCDVTSETPKSKGFGAAARTLTSKFRMKTGGLPEGLSLDGAKVLVPVQFDPPGDDSGDVGGARVVSSPNWTAMPEATRLAAVYPAKARAAGVREGRALITCAVEASGSLGGCTVESESPAGMGFGEAALLISGGFAVAPWTEDGKPMDGAKIRVPLRYIDGDAVPAAANP